MSLPRFLNRVVDAAAPALGGLDRGAVEEKLERTSVTLVTDAVDDCQRAGFVLAANLVARLYPRVVVVAPEGVATAAVAEVTRINPLADVTTTKGETTATLCYDVARSHAESGEASTVTVAARGWNVYVDETPPAEGAAAPAAALLAAAVGVSELFRIVFADDLADRGRHAPQPGAFNLVTLGEPDSIAVPESVDIGEVRLVGAGAIGQAAAMTLADAGARGTLLAVDDEVIELSNLQRYVLTRDSDVGVVCRPRRGAAEDARGSGLA
jgi:ThiF family